MPKYTRALRGRVSGQGGISTTWLGVSADAYLHYLTELGYAERTIQGYFGCVTHFVYWLSRKQVDQRSIRKEWIDQFLDQHLPRCRCALVGWRGKHEVRAALKHFLAMLRTNGICVPSVSACSPAAVAAELAEFHRYLIETRGLSDSTCTARLRYIRDFLVDRFGSDPIRISMLVPADIARFVARYTRRWTPGSIKALGISLRSYFRFKASQGVSSKALASALPRVAQWRLAGLPEALSAAESHLLLHAFDKKTATGKRDYAITRCLLDLGLRRAEVAQLQLDDIDWRTGTLRIHGKGKRIDSLPLPAATGQAIADYLCHARPSTTRREVFVRHRPPVNAKANLDVVRNAVRYAAQRCGLQARIRGTHILRRTAACRLAQAGTPFKAIADLLRHRSLDTTTIYAKVDLPSLRPVALPWPRRRT